MYADTWHATFEQLAEMLSGGYLDALFAVAGRWFNDQSSTKRTFLDDPSSLAGQSRYVTDDSSLQQQISGDARISFQ
ncbi:hypothetical protein PPGU19_081590 (plasmid) [Paraburkholderia sp. PGU19]|nr:hypothetical protein PPGU19_081590 [Paraburkholderia sp. PGU19]